MVEAGLPVNKLLKIIEIGDSLGIILPEEVLDRLKVNAGDHLDLTETAIGIALSSEFLRKMESMRRIVSENHEGPSPLG